MSSLLKTMWVTPSIPSGATIDALHGSLSLTSATGVGKKTQTGVFDCSPRASQASDSKVLGWVYSR